MNIPKSTVHDCVKTYNETGDCELKKRTGPSRITSKTEDNLIVLISKRDRRMTSNEIRAEVNTNRTSPLSRATIVRRLKDAGMTGCVAVRKPLLRQKNKMKRLAWAKAHVDWTIDQWRQVLFTDESKFEIFSCKRRVYVKRSRNEKMLPSCIVPTVKHGGGSVLVWGCFGNCQVGDLFRVQGILNKEGYHDILKNHAIPSGSKIIGPNFVMQQDNDPKHTSKLCKNYLEELEKKKKLKI